MKAQAILFTAVEQVELREVEIPAPGPGEVLIAAHYTLISPGTELRCRAGKQAGVVFPFIPGYSLVGQVLACGAGTTLQEGALVYCGGTTQANVNRAWGGHVSHAITPEAGAYPLPEGVSPLWGAAAHVAAIAYRGVRLGCPQPHETVAVIGLGLIGALAARLHALSGARVIAADLSPSRVAITQSTGIEAFTPEDDLTTAFRRRLPAGADVIVDATGAPAVLPQAIGIARDKPWDDSAEPGARFVVQGSYVSDFCVPYEAAFARELSFYTPRDAQPRDIRAVLDLMQRGKLSLEGIIGAVRPPEAAPASYAELAAPATAPLTIAFDWRAA